MALLYEKEASVLRSRWSRKRKREHLSKLGLKIGEIEAKVEQQLVCHYDPVHTVGAERENENDDSAGQVQELLGQIHTL